MQKIIKICNLDCAACAAELQEELEKIVGVRDASVDFVTQRVSVTCDTEDTFEKCKYAISHFEEVEIVEDDRRIIKIRNLDCAACAAELQEELEKIAGVSEAAVDFVTQRVSLVCTTDAFAKCKYAISHFEEVEIIDGGEAEKRNLHMKEVMSIALSVIFFVPALVLEIVGGYEWWSFGLFLCSFAVAGWSVVYSVGKNMLKTFKGNFGALLDENTLMLIAAVGAFAIRQNMEGAAVMLLYQIGEFLQALAVGSSRSAITRLMELKSESAIRLNGEMQSEVSPDELRVDDVIFIRKGDKVPVDCVLLSESAQLDTKSLTGEAYLREVSAGEEMLSGCVNAGAAIKARVLRLASESAVSKILDLVENSAAKKAKPEKFITRFARWYTPVVVLLALAVAVIPPLFENYNFSVWIARALNFLVISCPCALIISVPLTYFSGVGSLARCGVLVKGAVYLDTLSKIKVAAFDKTGTLTEGKFSVAKINGEQRVLELAAALEKSSSHPLAQAFAGVPTNSVSVRVNEIEGRGLEGEIGGKTVLVGSLRLLKERGIIVEEIETSALVIYVAEDGKAIGSIEIEDKIKADAADALALLKRAGIAKIAALSGDTETRAKEALGTLPIDEIYGGLLPDEKIAKARALKREGLLLYVGDGINDTPVLAESDIAVSMGALGSAAAIEASDLVLATDNLSALPKAVKGAKKTRKIVTQNIVFSIAVKVALMAVSLFGWIPLWAAVLGDVGVMLLAVLNSMRMRAKIK